MGLGTGLVLVFSDPMVDVLSEIGVRTDVPAFYISFVLAPLASNVRHATLKPLLESHRTVKCPSLLHLLRPRPRPASLSRRTATPRSARRRP